jgi:hypothetical protein
MRTRLRLLFSKSTKHSQTCPNGHVANSEGKCFTASCPYYVRAGQ